MEEKEKSCDEQSTTKDNKWVFAFLIAFGAMSCAGVVFQLITFGEFLYLALMGTLAGFAQVKVKDAKEKVAASIPTLCVVSGVLPVNSNYRELEIWPSIGLFLVCFATTTFFMLSYLELFDGD